MGGIEEKVYIKINDDKIKADPEKDVDRTSAEGKASSVQFLHFKFSEEQLKKFKDNKNSVILGIDHNLYSHTTKISNESKNSLMQDFI